MTHSPLDSRPAEKALVARILLEPSLMSSVIDLNPDDFVMDGLRNVFSSMLQRYKDGRSIDVITVEEDTGIRVDVLELSPAGFAPVEEYANAIKDASIRRRLSNTLSDAQSKIATAGSDPIATVSEAVERILRERGTQGLTSAKSVVSEYRKSFVTRAKHSTGLEYGIKPIDRTLLPMRAGRLVVFASRPGVGKTALAESVSDHASRVAPVLFVSLEMAAEELTDRAMARASGLDAGDIMRGKVDLTELDAHLKVREDLPIVYLDDGIVTTTDIYNAASRVKMQYGDLGLVIVDYLQLVGNKGDNEVQRVGAISHDLKRMAMKLKVPVLALAQLNRSIEYEGRTPRLSDLRDSGAIEQDADVVVIITGTPMTPQRDLFILKQRQGHTGRITMEFDGDTQRWDEPLGVW